MKKLKKNDLSKHVKKFLRKKKLKPSDYQVEFVEKTCQLLTKAFNTTYEVSSSALGTVEEQLSKVHDAIFAEEAARKAEKAADAPRTSRARKTARNTARKTVARKAAKKAVKRVAKKAARKTTRTYTRRKKA